MSIQQSRPCNCWLNCSWHSRTCTNPKNLPLLLVGPKRREGISYERWCTACWQALCIQEPAFITEWMTYKIENVDGTFKVTPIPTPYKDRIEDLRKKLSLEL